MLYNDVCGERLSALGLGMMRLPCTDEKMLVIDEAKTCEMIDFAIENGVNYFDNAWIYHGGNSERIAGKYLRRHKREDFKLATKFPGMLPEAIGNAPGIFETQMEKCACGFFDFYLLHNVNENNIEYYLDDEKYHIVSYFREQQKKGLIRHLGFSCHSSPETLARFLDRYGDIMEFGQLQLNYLDWHVQEACEKAALLDKYNIPVWIMEPLRGGRLANPPEEMKSCLKSVRPGTGYVELAFRFLQSLPNVKMVLSGMGNMEQLKENIRIFSKNRALTEKEFSQLLKIADGYTAQMGVPCTGCRYCVEKCPQKLDIPKLLTQYNEQKVSNGSWIARMVIGKLPENERPGACIGCRGCEKVCPQKIRISDRLILRSILRMNRSC